MKKIRVKDLLGNPNEMCEADFEIRKNYEIGLFDADIIDYHVNDITQGITLYSNRNPDIDQIQAMEKDSLTQGARAESYKVRLDDMEDLVLKLARKLESLRSVMLNCNDWKSHELVQNILEVIYDECPEVLDIIESEVF